MNNLYKTMLLFGLAMILQACVVGPPLVDGTYSTGADIEYDYVEPRVHFGTRSTVRVWLHPNYALPDAYDLALNHCRRYGLWPRPRRDWTYQTSRGRYLNYSCVGRRPNISRVHIHRRPWVNYRRRGTIAPPSNRPVVGRPVSRPVTRPGRPNYTSPSGRPRPVYSAPPPRRGTIAPPANEVGMPWEHNPNKGSVNKRPRPSKNEVGKPWEHNPSKGTIGNTHPSRPETSPSGRPTRNYGRDKGNNGIGWGSRGAASKPESSRPSRPSFNRGSPSSSRPETPGRRTPSRGNSNQKRSTLAL